MRYPHILRKFLHSHQLMLLLTQLLLNPLNNQATISFASTGYDSHIFWINDNALIPFHTLCREYPCYKHRISILNVLLKRERKHNDTSKIVNNLMKRW